MTVRTMIEPAAGQILSDQALQAIQTATLLIQRDSALVELAGVLNPDGTLSTWALSGRISAELRRFRSVGWNRVKSGARKPKNDFEQCLADICELDGPESQGRLFYVLVELRL